MWCHGETVAEYRRHEANMSYNAKMMLESTLTVLRSQRRYVRGDQRYEQAIKRGIKASKSYYGGELAHKVLAEVRKREWGQALRDALALVRYHPRILLRAYRKLESRARTRYGSQRIP